MKLRVKYGKSGSLKFIGHLDVMRFYQKAIRRAKLDISYSNGYSPHQIISFAAPMPLGMTSEGEYFDAEFNTVTTSEDMIDRLNEQMVDGMKVYDIVLLEDGAKNSMSVVEASDYIVSINDDYIDELSIEDLQSYVEAFIGQDEINIMKKTKKSEKVVDIKNSILKIENRDTGIYMLLSSGSVENLKPDLVMEALHEFARKEYNKYCFSYHRIETYLRNEGELMPLLTAGEKIG